MNHFEVFGLEPSVRIDVKALEQRHRELSLKFHPDRQTTGDAHSRLKALEQTTALNDALKVLKDPFRRASYLLGLKGIDLEREVSAPHDFLMAIMERREGLEAALAARDGQKARAMADEVARMKDDGLARATDALDRDAVREASLELVKVRYYTRFIDDVDAFEEEQS